jgi:hypothetical protein
MLFVVEGRNMKAKDMGAVVGTIDRLVEYKVAIEARADRLVDLDEGDAYSHRILCEAIAALQAVWHRFPVEGE